MDSDASLEPSAAICNCSHQERKDSEKNEHIKTYLKPSQPPMAVNLQVI